MQISMYATVNFSEICINDAQYQTFMLRKL
jgi:hypothetical protein